MNTEKTPACQHMLIVHPNTLVIGGAFSNVQTVETDQWGNLKRFTDWSRKFALTSMQVSGTVPSEKHWHYITRIQTVTSELFFKKQEKIPRYFEIYAALGNETKEIDRIFSDGMDEACRAAGIPTIIVNRISIRKRGC